jgi:hypothetical protein
VIVSESHSSLKSRCMSSVPKIFSSRFLFIVEG